MESKRWASLRKSILFKHLKKYKGLEKFYRLQIIDVIAEIENRNVAVPYRRILTIDNIMSYRTASLGGVAGQVKDWKMASVASLITIYHIRLRTVLTFLVINNIIKIRSQMNAI